MPAMSNVIIAFRERGVSITLKAAMRHAYGAIANAFGRRFLVTKIYSYKMLLDLNDQGISRTLLLFRERELEHKIMLERVLKPGMTVLDVGANIGYYALMELELIGPSGTLIAIEPSPANVALLKKNLALNGYHNVEVHQMAVSSRIEERDFFLSEMSNLNTFHDTGTGALHLKGETIKVRTITVPAIAGDRAIDLIRMDVEGHEVEVLSGLLPAIEAGQMAPMIIFETHLSRYSEDHDIESPLRKLFAAGYQVRLAGTSSLRGTNIVKALGYVPAAIVHSDGVERAIVENISADDAIRLIRHDGGLRTVLLVPPSKNVAAH